MLQGIGGPRKRFVEARAVKAYAGTFAASASEETVYPVAAFRDSDKHGCIYMLLQQCNCLTCDYRSFAHVPRIIRVTLLEIS